MALPAQGDHVVAPCVAAWPVGSRGGPTPPGSANNVTLACCAVALLPCLPACTSVPCAWLAAARFAACALAWPGVRALCAVSPTATASLAAFAAT